jgi:ribosomal protein S18 acetylase RimI-like enzyme
MSSTIRIEVLGNPSNLNQQDILKINALLALLSPRHANDCDIARLSRILSLGGNFIVARDTEQGNVIVGITTLICIVKPTGDYAEIQDVVVDEGCRGKGIGRAIMVRAIEIARGYTYPPAYIELTSNPVRIAANALYVAFGFVLLSVPNPELGEGRGTNLYRLYLRGK